MTVPILFLFLTDLSVAQEPQPNALLPRPSLDSFQGRGRFSNDSAILSDIDDRDTFCRGNENAVFPHPLAVNLYYRCRGNRRETWKCVGDLRFDRRNQKCAKAVLDSEGLPEADPCHEQEDGSYPLFDSNCRRYIRCKGGMTVDEKQCPTNERFSYSVQSCRARSEVACVATFCSPGNDDFFIAPGTKCQGYYYCGNGKRFDFLCPRGEIFDLQTKTCIDGGICYEPICVGRMDGVYADTTHECRRYFRCKGGELQEMDSCPGALRHNGFTCAPASIVHCEKPEKTAASIYNRRNDKCKQLRDGSHVVSGTDCRKIRTCAAGRTVATSECPIGYRYNGQNCFPRDLTECHDLCSGKKDGYYPDEGTNCREYYSCRGERLRERRKCENGTAFDGTTCSSGVTCSSADTEENLCEGLRDGFHPDYLNSCRRYFYCRDQQVILLSTCPAGTKWNGSLCVREFRCEAPINLTFCQGEMTGLYQDLSSNCSNYVYCNGGKGTILSCPEGELHDGRKCVKKDEYTCPNAVRDECYNQTDGYRLDEHSNCRSYYYCTNGRKVTYVCEGNLVFNGTRCVSPRHYACPYDANDCEGRFDGYYPDETTDCRSYFYCLRGKRITTLQCSGRKVFVSNGCALASDASSECEKATRNPCRGRLDGKYSDRKLNCEKYIRCENQVLTAEMFCPRGMAFDGTDCSPHPSCRTRDSSDNRPCDGSRIGFIPDYASGCKDYYFCIGNLKMTASCPNGSVFNGRVCQDSKTYECPSRAD